MKFAVITPVSGLEKYATLSSVHLLLPQLRNLPGYVDFYRRRQAAGDRIIWDNGAYEGQEDWSALIQAVELLRPDVCVLPDYLLQDWRRTWDAAQRFLSTYAETRRVEFMYVPQAGPGDIMGFCEGLFRALDDDRISWIGLSKNFPLKIAKSPSARADIATIIKRRQPGIKIHALGMMDGSLRELNDLRNSGCIDSVDSNAPVWRGYCGYKFKSAEAWPEIPVNYESAWIEHNHNIIMQNLTEVGVVTNSNTRSGSISAGA